jgi:Na+-translocating ferredoxin:NAD+ oxidoreductase RnfG subunit
MKKLENIVAVITLVSLIAAWIWGKQKTGRDVAELIRKNYPEIEAFDFITEDIYAGAISEFVTKDYFVIGESNGYGGPMRILICFDSLGFLKNITPIEHKETVAFFQKTQSNGFMRAFSGFDCQKGIADLEKIDVISGASFTSRAITNAVKDAAENLAYLKWGIQPQEEPVKKLSFGLKEITVVVLFLFSLIIYSSKFKYKKQLRWISLAVSMIILGFMTSTMMSIVNINALLMMFLPDLSDHLVWYLLFLIVFLPIIFKRKNYYCGSICPFGATQEFLGKIGKAKPRIPCRIREYLIWIPRILAWIFILIALISNNPGIQNYEIFSTFFRFIGADYQFALIAAVLILSIFISRPWCNYLCPVRGTTDYFKYWALQNR